MNLDGFIAKYNGQVVGDGQCGTLVRAYWNEVDLTVPPSYPDSKDYWFNPVPGYDKLTANPQPGDIAIYNGHGAFPEGHSAIYYDGRVFEQNADSDGSPAHLFNRANTYLLGYLRKQGGDMPSTIGEVEFNNLYFSFMGPHQPPTDSDRKRWIGAETNTSIRQMDADPRHQNYLNYVSGMESTLAAGSPTGTVLTPGNYIVKGNV